MGAGTESNLYGYAPPPRFVGTHNLVRAVALHAFTHFQCNCRDHMCPGTNPSKQCLLVQCLNMHLVNGCDKIIRPALTVGKSILFFCITNVPQYVSNDTHIFSMESIDQLLLTYSKNNIFNWPSTYTTDMSRKGTWFWLHATLRCKGTTAAIAISTFMHIFTPWNTQAWNTQTSDLWSKRYPSRDPKSGLWAPCLCEPCDTTLLQSAVLQHGANYDAKLLFE